MPLSFKLFIHPDGGSLTTGDIVNNGSMVFNSGNLSVTGVGGVTLGSAGPLGTSLLELGSGDSLDVTNFATVATTNMELFLGNNVFSPTYQTAFVSALEEIDGAAGRGEIVKVAVLAKDEDQVMFRVRQARMYANYHRSVKRLRAFVPIGKLVAVAGRTTPTGKVHECKAQ